jgi:hypothetical protein
MTFREVMRMVIGGKAVRRPGWKETVVVTNIGIVGDKTGGRP